nr:GNAT family N-acetyltransferase [Sedimentibacter sp.]
MDFVHESNRIYLKNEEGKSIAEVTFPSISDDQVNIDHTFVDGSLRGQGMAGKLMTALVDDLKKNNKKAKATCSYAVEWFEKHPEHSDVLITK